MTDGRTWPPIATCSRSTNYPKNEFGYNLYDGCKTQRQTTGGRRYKPAGCYLCGQGKREGGNGKVEGGRTEKRLNLFSTGVPLPDGFSGFYSMLR